MSDTIRCRRLIVSDVTSHSSQKDVLQFSSSDRGIFNHILPNILGLFGLLNKEHQMIFWCKKKNSRKIVLTYKKLRKTKRYPKIPSLTLSIIYYECVYLYFCLRYPAWNALAPYCHLLPARLCNILSHYLINGEIFLGKKKPLLNIKCMFQFSQQFLSETFLILRRTERDIIINVYGSSCRVPVILVRL